MKIIFYILSVLGGVTLFVMVVFLCGAIYMWLSSKKAKVCCVCYERFKAEVGLKNHYAVVHPEFQREWRVK